MTFDNYDIYLITYQYDRPEYCRARCFSYRDKEETGYSFLVVAESYCRYKAPAYYDDELIVRTHITELRRRSLRFGYEIVRLSDDQIIAEGETGHVVTDGDQRVRTLPEAYRALLTSAPIEDIHTSQLPEPRGGRVPDNAPD